MSNFQQYLLGMFLVIVGVNVVGSSIVHYLTWQKVSALESQTASLTAQVAATAVLPVPTSSPSAATSGFKSSTATPPALLKESSKVDQTAFDFIVESFHGKLTSIEDRLTTIEKKQSTVPVAAAQSTTQTVVKTSTQIKEQTVFIGSGSSASTDWTDIPSASIELNSANYSNVERVIFEATLSIVGGEARARLKNKTTGGIIYPSEVKHNSSTATTVLSSSFSLAGGSNEYVVQLRSSSNEAVVLDGARLRLFYR
jgi:hypothetical protein